MSQVLRDLTAARDLLASKGWIQDWMEMHGKHCAVGAIVAVADGYTVNDYSTKIAEPRTAQAIASLAELIPEGESVDPDPETTLWNRVAHFNNTHTEGEVMELFNRAITAETEIASVAVGSVVAEEVLV